MKKLEIFVGFVLGAVAGAAGGYFFAKNKFEAIAQEEIDSVKEVFSKKAIKVDGQDKDNRPITDYYHQFINNYDISNNLEERKEDDSEEEMPVASPYQITEDEFSEFDDYTPISLTYYAGDDTLANELDVAMDDYEDSVGTEFRQLLATDDVVYIRNDEKKCDYEIALDNGSYSDILEERPYLRD